MPLPSLLLKGRMKSLFARDGAVNIAGLWREKRASRAKGTSQRVKWSRNFSRTVRELWLQLQKNSRVENRYFPVAWQSGGLLTLGREPALGPETLEAQILLGCLLRLPWRCWFFGQLPGYPLTAWSTSCRPHPVPQGSHHFLSSPGLTFFLPPFISLHLCPNGCFSPTALRGGCKVADPFAKEGAVGMHAGSGARGSKRSQYNPSSSQRYQG